MKFPKKSLTWLVTGVAGFIGSHILETLLANNQRVLGVDNLFTGSTENLERVLRQVGRESWKNFSFWRQNLTDLIQKDFWPLPSYSFERGA